MCTPSTTWFLGPTGVGISVGSSFFSARSQTQTTERVTAAATGRICTMRCGVKCGSTVKAPKIFFCETSKRAQLYDSVREAVSGSFIHRAADLKLFLITGVINRPVQSILP